MTAEISSCGTYRYTLTRKISDSSWWGTRKILFIMLNPSSADATKNDPTIRRCISFAEQQKCSNLTVVNLFALRATDPKELIKHSDPVGPLNDTRIAEIVANHDPIHDIIVAAWGSHPFAKERVVEVIDRFGPFLCLGKTKDGSPRHPLYVKNGTSLIEL